METTPPARMIGIAYGPDTVDEAILALPRIAAVADCVELRLDSLEWPFDLERLLGEPPLPIIATLRPTDEGGRCDLPARARLDILLQAVERGAEYVDLEWNAVSKAALAAVHSRGAHVIVSRHDFGGMPTDMGEWWARIADAGADIVKVVGTATDVRDCLQVFRVLREAHQPTIAIAMGERGLPTRILSLREDSCFLTYAALERGQGTAPGQLSASELRRGYRARELAPSTTVYGLLGSHPDHERAMQYNAWFDATSIDAVAVPFVASEEASGIVASFRELSVNGWHVHGESLQCAMVRALDDLTLKARHQGKVNAITSRGGGLTGDWVESPTEQFAQWTDRCPPTVDQSS